MVVTNRALVFCAVLTGCAVEMSGKTPGSIECKPTVEQLQLYDNTVDDLVFRYPYKAYPGGMACINCHYEGGNTPGFVLRLDKNNQVNNELNFCTAYRLGPAHPAKRLMTYPQSIGHALRAGISYDEVELEYLIAWTKNFSL